MGVIVYGVNGKLTPFVGCVIKQGGDMLYKELWMGITDNNEIGSLLVKEEGVMIIYRANEI